MSIVMICMVVLSASLYFVIDTVQISRDQVTRLANVEGKLRVIGEMQALLKSEYVVNYSLSNYNTPSTNAVLYSCVLAGEPTTSTVCDDVNVNFFRPIDTGGQKFAGGPSAPTYLDRDGEDCAGVDGLPTETCRYKVVTHCTFRCPGTQGSCAMIKTMACDLEISSHGGSYVFRTFRSSEKTTLPTATYSIRLSNDLASMFVIK